MSIPVTPFVKHFTVEPGNMTRYELLYSVYEDSQHGVPHCSLTWLWKGTCGETFVWPKGSIIHSSYVCEKSSINRPDLIAILSSIKKRYPDSISELVGFEEYDENGLHRRLTCQSYLETFGCYCQHQQFSLHFELAGEVNNASSKKSNALWF